MTVGSRTEKFSDPWSGQAESSRVDRVGSAQVGSGRIGSGRVGSGRVRSDRVGSGRVRLDQVRSGQVESGRRFSVTHGCELDAAEVIAVDPLLATLQLPRERLHARVEQVVEPEHAADGFGRREVRHTATPAAAEGSSSTISYRQSYRPRQRMAAQRNCN